MAKDWLKEFIRSLFNKKSFGFLFFSLEKKALKCESPYIRERIEMETKKEAPAEAIELTSSNPKLELKIKHYESFSVMIELLDYEIDKRKRRRGKGIRILTSIRKRLIKMQRGFLKIISRADRISIVGKRTTPNGLTIPLSISDELAEFLGVDSGTMLSRSDVMRGIATYIHLKDDEQRTEILDWGYLNTKGRNLQIKDKRMAIKPDSKLSKLLDYPSYKRDVNDGKVSTKNKKSGTETIVTDDTLYYYTIQRLLSKHFIKVDS